MKTLTGVLLGVVLAIGTTLVHADDERARQDAEYAKNRAAEAAAQRAEAAERRAAEAEAKAAREAEARERNKSN
ncbi:hypothetical protein [Pseudomonas monteilii]|uniref:hypothetical protein n=1 Tax=Pseudomonas monteilii TaxID=76759 RepID=UPI0034E1C041